MTSDPQIDLALHLRTIHMTLISVAFALILAVQGIPSELEDTRTELNALLEFSDSINVDNDLLFWDRRYAMTLMGSRKSPSSFIRPVPEENRILWKAQISTLKDEQKQRTAEILDIPGVLGYFELLNIPEVIVKINGEWKVLKKELRSLPPSFTLNEFKANWNYLESIDSLGIYKSSADSVFLPLGINGSQWSIPVWGLISDPGSNTRRWRRNLNSFFFTGSTFTIGTDTLTLPTGTNFIACISCSKQEIGNLILPITYSLHAVNLETMFSTIVLKGRRTGPFGEAFPYLAEFYEGLGSLEISQAKEIIEQEQRRAGESIKIIGFEISGATLRSWGLLLLIGVQVYFLIHLRQFTQTATAGSSIPKVPWIGLYRGLGTIAFLGTAVVLPVISAALLGGPIGPDGLFWRTVPAWIGKIVGIVPSVLLSLGIIHESNMLKKVEEKQGIDLQVNG